jgi:hypothetical protein
MIDSLEATARQLRDLVEAAKRTAKGRMPAMIRSGPRSSSDPGNDFEVEVYKERLTRLTNAERSELDRMIGKMLKP